MSRFDQWFPFVILAAMVLLVAKCSHHYVTTPEPENRNQYAIELDCGDYKRYLWKPVDTIGIAYREDGREVNDIPSCVQVSLGKVDKIGEMPEGEAQ